MCAETVVCVERGRGAGYCYLVYRLVSQCRYNFYHHTSRCNYSAWLYLWLGIAFRTNICVHGTLSDIQQAHVASIMHCALRYLLDLVDSSIHSAVVQIWACVDSSLHFATMQVWACVNSSVHSAVMQIWACVDSSVHCATMQVWACVVCSIHCAIMQAWVLCGLFCS